MEKEFIPYQEALALKELGFNEPCFGYRESTFGKEKVIIEPSGLITNTNFSKIFGEIRFRLCTPTYSQAFRFFREKYNLRGFIGFRPNVKKFDYHIYDMSLSGMEYVKQRTMEDFNKDPKVGTYEEAELACLAQLIEIVKNK